MIDSSVQMPFDSAKADADRYVAIFNRTTEASAEIVRLKKALMHLLDIRVSFMMFFAGVFGGMVANLAFSYRNPEYFTYNESWGLGVGLGLSLFGAGFAYYMVNEAIVRGTDNIVYVEHLRAKALAELRAFKPTGVFYMTMPEEMLVN